MRKERDEEPVRWVCLPEAGSRRSGERRTRLGAADWKNLKPQINDKVVFLPISNDDDYITRVISQRIMKKRHQTIFYF